MSHAIFFDRDGTLIENRHYLSEPDGVSLLPGVTEAMRRLVEAQCRLFLFTNQSGVGRGWFNLADVERCNCRMIELIGLGPNLFADVCIAIESPNDEPRYRKPSPRFIEEMIALHGLDRNRCWMVGDSPSDWQAGRAAGVGIAAVVPNGSQPVIAGDTALPALRAFLCVNEFVDWLLTSHGHSSNAKG
jgi:D-glycero-D-manno-heptose 1,7-bisphosphate phosphatase